MVTNKLLKLAGVGLTGFFWCLAVMTSRRKWLTNKPAAIGCRAVWKRWPSTAKAVADQDGFAKSGFTSAQEKAIGELVRKTLLEKPEILQEAFAALEKRDKAEQQKRKISALSGSVETLFRSKLSPTAGNPKGDVTVVEFFDYNCPYCRKAFKDLETVMGH